MSENSKPKHVLDNRANQLNPAHPEYYRSRGYSPEQAADLAAHHKPALDNHANQLNPDAEAYRRSRGLSHSEDAGPAPTKQTGDNSK